MFSIPLIRTTTSVVLQGHLRLDRISGMNSQIVEVCPTIYRMIIQAALTFGISSNTSWDCARFSFFFVNFCLTQAYTSCLFQSQHIFQKSLFGI